MQELWIFLSFYNSMWRQAKSSHGKSVHLATKHQENKINLTQIGSVTHAFSSDHTVILVQQSHISFSLKNVLW